MNPEDLIYVDAVTSYDELIKCFTGQSSGSNPSQRSPNKALAFPKTKALSERYVTLCNILVSASQGLVTLSEHRVIKSCLGKLDSKDLNGGRYTFKLTAAEYALTFHVDVNTAYEQLKAASSTLLNRVFERKVGTRQGKLIVHKDHWVSGITYHEGEAWLELRFSPEATPYLTALKGRHTTYLLQHVTRLRSVYSWRMLELLMQFKDTGWKHVGLAEFQWAMGAKKSHVDNFKDLRRWVIEPAIKELAEKNSWKIEYKSVKAGRKVIALRFDFEFYSRAKHER